ncbi:MAG: phosphatidylglycerophosphatase A family protein [Pyrinomonadaceae bacterium]
MAKHEELIDISAAPEARKSADEKIEKKTALDYFSLAIATCGVGYLPLAPGTWGSLVGVGIYLFIQLIETKTGIYFLHRGWSAEQIAAWIYAKNSIGLLLFCFLGIWAASRAARIFQKKDPQKIVVDEVLGQLIVFAFAPFTFSWKFVSAGFVLFRLFDIWKPYPIRSLENLPAGIGVCADDILAGVYGGICLALIYAFSLTF